MPANVPRDPFAQDHAHAPERDTSRGREAPPQREPGRDALTRPPGAHPLGIGAGIAAGGAAGAFIGAAAGPVGAVVGGALGAVAGGYLGREAAEVINPTAEDRHWCEAYVSRPYVVMGETYEYYRPAYHFGWESYRRFAAEFEAARRDSDRDDDDGDPADRETWSFDELEPELAVRWAESDASATLPWERARPAARDAWNRVARHGADSTIDLLERLRETCLDSAMGFHAAADGLKDPAYIELVQSWAHQREALADELATLSARLGGDLEDSVAAAPTSKRRLWMNIRDARPNGPHAILTECERSEDYIIREYDSALVQTLPRAVTPVLQRHYTVLRVTHDQVRSLRDAALG